MTGCRTQIPGVTESAATTATVPVHVVVTGLAARATGRVAGTIGRVVPTALVATVVAARAAEGETARVRGTGADTDETIVRPVVTATVGPVIVRGATATGAVTIAQVPIVRIVPLGENRAMIEADSVAMTDSVARRAANGAVSLAAIDELAPSAVVRRVIALGVTATGPVMIAGDSVATIDVLARSAVVSHVTVPGVTVTGPAMTVAGSVAMIVRRVATAAVTHVIALGVTATGPAMTVADSVATIVRRAATALVTHVIGPGVTATGPAMTAGDSVATTVRRAATAVVTPEIAPAMTVAGSDEMTAGPRAQAAPSVVLVRMGPDVLTGMRSVSRRDPAWHPARTSRRPLRTSTNRCCRCRHGRS